MTLIITLTPELERRLRAKAESAGLDAGRYVEHLVAGHLSPPNRSQQASLWDTLSPEEWKRQTREWTASHGHIPPLPDEAVSREAFYEGRIDEILGGHGRSPEMDPAARTALSRSDGSD